MRVFMIGGTGLLGSEGAKELIRRGDEVSSIALPPISTGAELPPKMKIEFGNYMASVYTQQTGSGRSSALDCG